MKKQMLFSICLLICIIGYSQVDSLTSNDIVQLKNEQIKMFEMFCNGDAVNFKAIVGDDYKTINADGTYMGKDQMLKVIPKFKGSTYKILEQTDRVYNNLVISTGRAKFYFGPILAADVYFHQVWILRNSKWEFISWQGTMTGIPKNYSVYFVLIILFLIIAIRWVILRRRKNKV